MKKIISFVLITTLCVLFGSNFVSNAESATNIEAIDKKGLQSLVDSHKGKIVLVNFFATWCPPCREEIPGLVSIANAMPNDVVVIGLSVDENPKLLPDFAKNMKMEYPYYLATHDLVRSFKVSTIPHNLVYSQDGKLVANAAGFVTEKELKEFINLLLKEKANAKPDNS